MGGRVNGIRAPRRWRDVVAWLDGARRQAGRWQRARSSRGGRAAREAGRRGGGEIRECGSSRRESDRRGRGDGRALGAAAEVRWLEAVHGALSLDSELPEAHAMLADHHLRRLTEAELARRDEDAAVAEEMLRIHDRGRHTAFLRGDGRLTLVTDPPGAEVRVERFVLQDRRLVPVPESVLGPTPLIEVPLQRGSYLLRLRAPGRAEVRYPVLIERNGHWDGCAPGEREPTPVALPEEGELGPDDVYVPAGWCWIGGDAATPDSLPRRRVWIDAFVMRRFPVTTGEYIELLNDLVATGREAEAMLACPRAHEGSDSAGEPIFGRDGRGMFESAGGRDWTGRSLSTGCAMASRAGWPAEGRPWRLPTSSSARRRRGVSTAACSPGAIPEPIACSPHQRVRGALESVGALFDESPMGAGSREQP